MTTASGGSAAAGRKAVAGLLLAGAAVAVSTGVYARAHDPAGRPLFTLGFSGVLPMKAWLTSGVMLLLVVQAVTALWMWGRLPAVGPAPAGVAVLHRWSGSAAFVLTLPVAFHCIWSLGFGTSSTRVLVHSLAGCLFYGAYATKMLGLRVRGLPARMVPVTGGVLLASVVLVWLTSAVWFFTRSGLPLT